MPSRSRSVKKKHVQEKPVPPPEIIAQCEIVRELLADESGKTVAGDDGQPTPIHVEICAGRDETRRGLPLWCSREVDLHRGSHPIDFVSIAEGGGRLILVKGTTKAEALDHLQYLQRTIAKYWAGICAAPDVIWATVYDVLTSDHDAGGEVEAGPADDANPSTWPEERASNARRGMDILAKLFFLKVDKQTRDAWMNRWLGLSGLSPQQKLDIRTFAERDAAQFEEEIASMGGQPA